MSQARVVGCIPQLQGFGLRVLVACGMVGMELAYLLITNEMGIGQVYVCSTTTIYSLTDWAWPKVGCKNELGGKSFFLQIA